MFPERDTIKAFLRWCEVNSNPLGYLYIELLEVVDNMTDVELRTCNTKIKRDRPRMAVREGLRGINGSPFALETLVRVTSSIRSPNNLFLRRKKYVPR